jgi:hypothetical protein
LDDVLKVSTFLGKKKIWFSLEKCILNQHGI